MRKSVVVLVACCFWASLTVAQDQKPAEGASAMPGMNMSGKDASDMPGIGNGGAHAMRAMEGRHMDMGPHMKMTSLREPKPGDAERAAKVAESARKVAEKYEDYKTALADGFKIFMPNVPQKQYHFTNYSYAFEAIRSDWRNQLARSLRSMRITKLPSRMASRSLCPTCLKSNTTSPTTRMRLRPSSTSILIIPL